MTFARLLKEWRTRQSFTQIEASQLFGVPLRTWEGWERSRSTLTARDRVIISITHEQARK